MEQTDAVQNKTKTLLVVDDNPSILQLVVTILANNYCVLQAPDGIEALKLSRTFEGEIDLLLSDFQMPGMSGMDLATQMNIDRPRLKILLMSGFEGGMLVLNEGWHFMQKPFIPSQLRALITTLLMSAK